MLVILPGSWLLGVRLNEEIDGDLVSSLSKRPCLSTNPSLGFLVRLEPLRPKASSNFSVPFVVENGERKPEVQINCAYMTTGCWESLLLNKQVGNAAANNNDVFHQVPELGGDEEGSLPYPQDALWLIP
jgi:hypothetical protein